MLVELSSAIRLELVPTAVVSRCDHIRWEGFPLGVKDLAEVLGLGRRRAIPSGESSPPSRDPRYERERRPRSSFSATSVAALPGHWCAGRWTMDVWRR